MTIDAAEATAMFRREPTRMLDVGAAEVAYRTVGRGPDVLFVHGWPVHSATFRLLLPFLADHVTCHLIDLPGAGSSRWSPDTPLSIALHIESVRRVIDLLGLEEVTVVGHDSGGLIARHAVAGDRRLRSLVLVDTEPSHSISWKFRAFLAGRHVPGFGSALGWAAGAPRLRRNRLLFGDAFADRSLLDGEFDEFFLQPLRHDAARRRAAARILDSWDYQLIHDLPAVHRSIHAPVALIWGEHDRFFPLASAEAMLSDFAAATLSVIPGAGLFAHEERPDLVAAELLSRLH